MASERGDNDGWARFEESDHLPWRKPQFTQDWKNDDTSVHFQKQKKLNTAVRVPEQRRGYSSPQSRAYEMDRIRNDWSGVGITATTFKATRETDPGISFLKLNGVVVVSNIARDGIFASTELRIGDEIVRVNNKDCRTCNAGMVANAVEEATGLVTVIATRKFFVGFSHRKSARKHFAPVSSYPPAAPQNDSHLMNRDDDEGNLGAGVETREEPSTGRTTNSSVSFEENREHQERSGHPKAARSKFTFPFRKERHANGVISTPKKEAPRRPKLKIPKVRFAQRQKKQVEAPPSEASPSKQVFFRITEQNYCCSDENDKAKTGSKRKMNVNEITVVNFSSPPASHAEEPKKKKRKIKRKNKKVGTRKEGKEIPYCVRVPNGQKFDDSTCVSGMTEMEEFTEDEINQTQEEAQVHPKVDPDTSNKSDSILHQLFTIGCRIEDQLFGTLDDG